MFRGSLDIVIAFAVIVASLLITILVQMFSAALSLRGKNLSNALALTFQTIEPNLREYAHELAAQILRDPIFSDSHFAPKDRPQTGGAMQTLIDAERTLMDAGGDLETALADPARKADVPAAQAAVKAAERALAQATAALPASFPLRYR